MLRGGEVQLGMNRYVRVSEIGCGIGGTGDMGYDNSVGLNMWLWVVGIEEPFRWMVGGLWGDMIVVDYLMTDGLEDRKHMLGGEELWCYGGFTVSDGG
ncbi:hypothetical protein Tco_1575879 [Tanacetum coccineum]